MVEVGTQNDLIRWIPLLPLLVATFHGISIGVLRRPMEPRMAAVLSCAAVLISFVLSCYAFRDLLALPPDSRVLIDDVYTWIGAGVGASAMSAEVSFRLDPLSAVMILIVTFVGSMIHIYSIGYMDDDHRDDKGTQRFFCYLNLFTFAMLVLVLGDNLVLMFLGWEGVGLCSYLLIGFWYSDNWNAYCGSKAFIVNRIGDFGFLIGLFLLFGALSETGHPAVSFAGIEEHFGIAERFHEPQLGLGVLATIGLLLFLGAAGKSAQIPLYVWLPDAMAGPSPVSALIHAATMVTAGVYLIARTHVLFELAPAVLMAVAIVGLITQLTMGISALHQRDIKRILAYSTISQLGYMFLAAGCGGYTAAIFHLGTHAFFKALLFLSAGAVILAMHHEQDMQKMGGLWHRLRRTRWVFFVGVYAIAGFPPFSGFFSKDEILVAVWASHVPGHAWLYGIGMATAGLTAFYMFRLWHLTFMGECRAPNEVRSHIKDPNGFVLNPLWVLAFFSAVAGIVGLPQIWGDLIGIEDSNSLANFLKPVFAAGEPHHIAHSTELWMAFWAVAIALTGTVLAWLLYVRKPGVPGWLAAQFSGFYRMLLNKYYIDELYDAVIVRPLVAVSDRVLYRTVDAGLIDGIGVNGTARGIRAVAANGLKYAQTGLTQSYIFFMIVGAVAIVGYLLR